MNFGNGAVHEGLDNGDVVRSKEDSEAQIEDSNLRWARHSSEKAHLRQSGEELRTPLIDQEDRDDQDDTSVKVLHLDNADQPPRQVALLDFVHEMVIEAVPPLLLGVCGLMFAGSLLNRVRRWTAFERINELFVLVPILSSLKGNLEMNLSARFSTSANVGELDIGQVRKSLIWGNLALIQVQGILVSAVAGLIAFVLGLIGKSTGRGKLSGWHEIMMMVSTSMVTASLSAAIVANFMCGLVVLSRRFGINPDNLATPLAGALSDLLVLVLLTLIASSFVTVANTVITTIIFISLLVAIPFIIFLVYKNPYIRGLLWTGWAPLFLSMAISSLAGFAFGTFVEQFDGLALISPVLTGLVGSLGSVSASRISTALHAGVEEEYNRVQLALFLIHLPIQILFLTFLWISGQLNFNFFFISAYLVSSCLAVVAALAIAKHLTLWLWGKDYDPDAYCLPILSSCMDVTCQGLLISSFFLVTKVFRQGVTDNLPDQPQ